MDLRLVPVTSENWEDAVYLTTDPERKYPLDEQWVASNAFSLLQCQYDPDWDCRMMMDGDIPVGFVFYGYWREKERYLLCRYMFDEKHQKKGYGKAFLPMVVEHIRGQYGCGDLYTTAHDDNHHAVYLYTAYGFEQTEEMDEEERVYVLREGK